MNTDNNILIADFMGKEHNDNKIVVSYDYVCGVNPSGKLWEEMKYHSSWDWLMEVVDKIEDTQDGTFRVKILDKGTIIKKMCLKANNKWKRITIVRREINDTTTKKDSVYKACVEFIKWYNENN